MRKQAVIYIGALAAMVGAAWCAPTVRRVLLGRQRDGGFIVSSGQRVEAGAIAFPGRASDIALHPEKDLAAVLSQNEVFLCSRKGILARTRASLGDGVSAGFHGIIWTGDRRGANWTPDGMRFVVSTDQGYLQEFLYEDRNLFAKERISLLPDGETLPKDEDTLKHVNPVPGGMCLTRDRRRLFVAAAGRDSVIEVDIATHKRVAEFSAQALPYEVRLSPDERTLIVSNWGGRRPKAGDRTAKSADEDIVVDERNVALTGTVSLIDRASGETTHIPVGIHPTGMAVQGDRVFVANAMSDSISEVSLSRRRVVRTMPIRWGSLKLFGAMPNALAIQGDTLYACDGGDNAVCEIDIPSGAVRGFRGAGYYPSAIQIAHDGRSAYVLNAKGNGSVENTAVGNPGNPHDFQGTLTVLDLRRDLRQQTALVARDNRWSAAPASARPKLPVYNGAVKHVLYIIKENQTYDSIFGDMEIGNGDPKLCIMGERVMPNHRAMARQFTLFDNGYVSGTNSADGHAWCTQSVANDYLERFYVGYSRTYPDDGDCAMSIAPAGCLWDQAIKKHKSVRIYGEFCDDELSRFAPRRPKDWFEAYADYKSGRRYFKYTTGSQIPAMRPYICPTVHYWPLIQCDNAKADEFIREYREYSKRNRVPELMVLCLGCDHGEGLNPNFPTTRAMQADNDLAYGRVVDAVTHSPQWKETCIFMIEDDGQAEPDHVDGHRTAYMVLSPYVKRRYVDSTLYTTTDMLRSIELMLGLDPMTRFDALARPITTCFTDTPDLTPYRHVPNNVPLDERNPSPDRMTAEERYWYNKTRLLDWSRPDVADPYWVSRVNWFCATHGRRPYPDSEGRGRSLARR